MMNWIRKAPTALLVTIVIVCGLGVITTIGGFVLLEYAGRDTTDYRAFVNVLVNAATLAVAGADAEENTNGTLTAKDREITALRTEVARLQAGR